MCISRILLPLQKTLKRLSMRVLQCAPSSSISAPRKLHEWKIAGRWHGWTSGTKPESNEATRGSAAWSSPGLTGVTPVMIGIGKYRSVLQLNREESTFIIISYVVTEHLAHSTSVKSCTHSTVKWRTGGELVAISIHSTARSRFFNLRSSRKCLSPETFKTLVLESMFHLSRTEVQSSGTLRLHSSIVSRRFEQMRQWMARIRDGEKNISMVPHTGWFLYRW